MDKKRVGIILMLVGIAALLVSLVFSSGYNSDEGFLGSIRKMEIVLRENPAGSAPVPLPNPSADIELQKRLDIEYERRCAAYELGEKQRVAFPYKYFLAVDIVFFFIGLGYVVLAGEKAK